MATRRGRDALEALAEMGANDPELQAEYERIGPRYAVIGELVRVRIRDGISQRELARRLGVSPSVLSRIESADDDPRLDTLVRIARALDMDIKITFESREQSRTDYADGAQVA